MRLPEPCLHLIATTLSQPVMLPPSKDFLTLSGLIAAFSVLLGSAIGIHSLRQPSMSKGRWLALATYAALAVW